MASKTNPTDREIDDSWDDSRWAGFKRVMIPAIVFAIGLGLALGGVSAMAVIARKGELGFASIAMALPFLLIGLGIIVYAFRKWPTLRVGDPDTPRTRRLGKGVYVLMIFAIGTAMIMVTFMPEARGPNSFFGNGPIPPALGAVMAIGWMVFMPILSIYNRRNVDEVDRSTFEFGETVGFQVFAVLAPVWWVAWRGGFVPQPDVMIIFVIVLVASTIGNLCKRFV